VVDRSRTFFDLQASARRRSLLLLTGSFAILWVVASVITVFLHFEEGECRPSELGETQCASVFSFNPIVSVIVGIFVLAYIGVAYLASGRAALALAGAHPATGPEYAQLRNIVEEMSIASGTPMPKVYVVEDPSPNAFATGRNPGHAAVTVTTGLLAQLSRRELKGVVAHEVAHIKNRDISITTLAVLTAGTIAVLADLSMRIAWYTMLTTRRSRNAKSGGAQAGIAVAALALAFVLYLFALPAALLLRAAISRQRESLADVSAVQYTRDPAGIRSALEKLEADGTSPTKVSTATAHMWIDEPKPAGRPQRRILSGLFDTHPPMGERISTLRQMEGLDPAARGPNDPWPTQHRSGPESPFPPPMI
jgi:heat shock protein HtpX